MFRLIATAKHFTENWFPARALLVFQSWFYGCFLDISTFEKCQTNQKLIYSWKKNIQWTHHKASDKYINHPNPNTNITKYFLKLFLLSATARLISRSTIYYSFLHLLLRWARLSLSLSLLFFVLEVSESV